MPALLEVAALRAYYGARPVLHGLSFAVPEGGIATLLGANGAGKTTTLRALCKMLRVEGEIRFAGQRIDGYSTEDIVRLGIARALMLRPRLLLLDEPSFGLAPLLVEEIFRIMRQINQQERVSVLLVEQNASLALDLADEAYLIETGRLVLAGKAAEIAKAESVRRSYLGY